MRIYAESAGSVAKEHTVWAKYLGVLCLSLIFFCPGLVRADSGSGDSFGYMWTNTNDETLVSYDWTDIRGTGTVLSGILNDTVTTARSLPFGFDFYGNTRNSIYISSNGWISFTDPAGNSYPANQAIPTATAPAEMIAPMWDDLSNTSATEGGVYFSVTGSAPNRQAIVQWYLINGAEETEFQVILFERVNQIKFQYRTIASVYGGGISASAGIQGGSTAGNAYSTNQAVLAADLAVLFHNSTISTVSASINPTTTSIGALQSFTYTVNNITSPNDTKMGRIDQITITNPFSTVPTVTGVTIDGSPAFVQNSSSKPTEPGFATWNYSAGTLTVQTNLFDIKSSVAVSYIQTIPSVSTGSYPVSSTADAVLDLSAPVTPGTIPNLTVTIGALNSIVIRNAPSNGGSVVGNLALTTDQSVTLYAAGYDAGSNYIGDQAVDWALTGTLDGSGATNATSFTFSPAAAPRTGSIVATKGSISDATGTITVSPGALASVIVRNAPSNGGSAVGTLALTTDQSVTLYAAGYDAESNYIADQAANWTLTGTLDGSGATGATSFTFSPNVANTSGTIVATVGTFSDPTGTITVGVGALNYLIVRNAPANGGVAVTTLALTTDQSVTLYAAGYDAGSNYIGDQTVNWTLTGTLDGSGATNTTSYTFSPAAAPRTGSIIATKGSISDGTGTITVSPGALASLTIRNAPNNGGSVVNTVSLNTDQSITLYAAGYDAESNYIADQAANWTLTGTLDGGGATGATSFTFSPNVANTSGTIVATVGTFSDPTGTITVTGGGLSYLIVRNAPANGGAAVTTLALTTDQSVTLYAAGYDAGSNYIGDQAVDWTLTGTLDGSGATNATSFTFSPAAAPRSGSIIATKGSISDGTGTITVSPGALATLTIRNGPNNGGSAVGNLALTTNQSVTLYAAGYDAKNNYISDQAANWTLTGTLDGSGATGATSFTFSPHVANTSGTIVATVGAITDPTGTITVSGGTLSYLTIRNAPANGGVAVTTLALTTDQSVTLYAAGYDAGSNYLGDQAVDWTLTGTLDGSGATNATSFTFSPAAAPRTGSIVATKGSISDVTGTITVSPGALSSLTVRDAPNNGGSVVNTVSLNTDQSVTLYAAGYDAESNYIADQAANWTLTGTLDGSGATGATSFTFSPNVANTSGTIVATVGAVSDPTGTITVTGGGLSYLIVRNAPANGGAAVTTLALTTDQSVTLYAAGYDAGSNYIGDQAVDWTLTGTLDGSGATNATSFTFSPAAAPRSGSIIATKGSISDATGTITVSPGALATLTIRNGANNGGSVVGNLALTTDQSVTLYAAGYDAKSNYIADQAANWTLTGTLDGGGVTGATSFTFSPNVANTSGTIVATVGAVTDPTGTITVTGGGLSYLIIRNAASNGGSAVDNLAITTDQSVTLYAAGYDAGSNYIGDQTVDWSLTGTLNGSGTTGATSFTFSPSLAPTSGSIIAVTGSISDATGTITVSPGALSTLTIRNGANNGGSAVNTVAMNTDQSVTLYAAGYDAESNYISDQAANWTLTGTLDGSGATGATSFTFSPNVANTSGTIVATVGAISDPTGTITVGVGALSYLIIRSAPGGAGSVVANVSVTADDTLRLYSAGYDAGNNYINDVPVTWSLTGTLDGSGTSGVSSFSFIPTLAPTSGSIIATSGSINDGTGTISVAAGALAAVRINQASGAGAAAFGDATLTASQSITLYAAGYDKKGNYRSAQSVTWASTGTLDPVTGTGTSHVYQAIHAPASGTITAASGLLNDATGTITVIEGTLSYIRIRSAASGGGTEVNDVTITADQSLTLYAAGYDVNNNYLGDLNVTWSSNGTLDNVSAAGPSFAFNPIKAPTTGQIIARSGEISDFTGTITVNVGALYHIAINNAAGAGGTPVGVVNMTAGQTLNLYASGYDQDGNYRSAQSVTWGRTGTLQTVTGTGSTLAFTPTLAPTSGTITATSGTFSTATGLITVSVANLANIVIRTAPNGGGAEFTTASITADQSITLYAAGYDGNNNFVQDVTASWSSTGTLDGIIAAGTSYVFNPVKAPASGTIEARNGQLYDNTGIIDVAVGVLASVRINQTSGATGLAFDSYNMTADQNVTMYSAGYDADGNFRSLVSAVWSSTGTLDAVSFTGTALTFNPVKAPATGTVVATFSGHMDDTGPINVSVGALSTIRINDQSGAGGVAVGVVTLTVGQSLSLFASGYDADGNYLSGVNASWSTTGSLDSRTGLGSSFTFTPTTANTSGLISATYSGKTDVTGLITVQVGSLASIKIRTAANGQGTVFTTYDMTADQVVTLYAAAYDGGGNYLSDTPVAWTTTGTLNSITFTGTNFTFSPTTAPTSGTIVATKGLLQEETGLIHVSPGQPVQIVDPTTFNGERTTVAGSGMLLRVKVVDQHGNPVEGVPVTYQPAILMSDPNVTTDATGEAKTVITTPRDQNQTIVEVFAQNLDVFYLTVNGLRYVDGSLLPTVTSRGQNYAFSVRVSNPGSIAVPISLADTKLSFSDDLGHTFTAALQSPSTLNANNSSILLQFISAQIDPAFKGGKYSPQIQMIGRTTFAGMNGVMYTRPGALTIGDSEITLSSLLITGPGGTSQVLQGDHVQAILTLLNSGAPLMIDPFPQTTITFKNPSTGADLQVLNLTRTDNITTITTNVPTNLIFSFDLPANFPVGPVDVYATVSFDGGNLIKSPVDPSGTFDVFSGGDATYTANSLTPNSVVPRQTVGFKATFVNSGTSGIVLNPSTTYLEILTTSIGQIHPVGQYTLVGNSSTTVSFDNISIPSSQATGSYNIRFVLSGTLLNGDAYSKTINATNQLSVIHAAQVSFSKIDIPADTVRQGQTGVGVDYTLRNTGNSDARISAINYRFKQGATVIPASDWLASDVSPALPVTITPGAQQVITVNFNIANMATLGTVQPAPIVSYNDVKTPAFTDISETVVLNDNVFVIKPASVRTESFDIVKNTQAPNAPVVNEGQTFTLSLTIRNTGDDLIDQANVDILRNGVQEPVTQLNVQDIQPQQTKTVTFTQSFPTEGSINYQAIIVSAIDAVGSPAVIGQPVDNIVNVEIQKASNLLLDLKLTTGAADTDSVVLSEGQQFSVKLHIANSGHSQFKDGGNGMAGLLYDRNIFRLVNEADSVRNFISTDTLVRWEMAAAATTPADSFKAIRLSLKQIPVDKNTGHPVPYAVAADTVKVRVQESGKILKNNLVLDSPAGVKDGIVSTNQHFTLKAEIVFNEVIAKVSRQAALTLPEDYSALSNLVVNLPGESDTIDVTWDVVAPKQALAQRQLLVNASGYDRNSNLLIRSNSTPVMVTAVKAADLALSLEVVKLGGNNSDTLSLGQTFILQAQVDNDGEAGITGVGSLYLENLAEDSLVKRIDTLSVTKDTLNFSPGIPVKWYLKVLDIPENQNVEKMLVDLRAEALRKKPDPETRITAWKRADLDRLFQWAEQLSEGTTDITVSFLNIPFDENTGSTAIVKSPSVTQTLYLQEAARIGIDTVIVPKVLSTGQTFALRVKANLSENLIDPMATIIGPAAFNIAPKSLFLDDLNTAQWNITVPADYAGAAAETLIVLISGEDANSGNKIGVSRPDTSFIRIEKRPVLQMEYQIISPPLAVESNTLSRGQSMEVEVWTQLAPNTGPLDYAGITGTGSILLEDRLFNEQGFERIEGETYEKTFSMIGQHLRFRMRASLDDKTVSLNFRFNERPEDQNSGTDVDLDVNTSRISIPVTVRQKEIRVVASESANTPDIFTRGTSRAVLFSFEISNKDFDDTLYVSQIALKFLAAGDTILFSSDALKNMLDSVFVGGAEFLSAKLGEQKQVNDQGLYAAEAIPDTTVRNPFRVSFDVMDAILPDEIKTYVVMVRFTSGATSRRFRTALAGVTATDVPDIVPVIPVKIVDKNGQDITDKPLEIERDFSVVSNDPSEAFVTYPNPFGQPPYESAKIRFLLQAQSNVRILIFTLQGELVRSHWNFNLNGLPPALYDGNVVWDGKNDKGERVLNGVYLCAIEINSGGNTQRYITKIAYIK